MFKKAEMKLDLAIATHRGTQYFSRASHPTLPNRHNLWPMETFAHHPQNQNHTTKHPIHMEEHTMLPSSPPHNCGGNISDTPNKDTVNTLPSPEFHPHI
jgi:hypothetical protein